MALSRVYLLLVFSCAHVMSEVHVMSRDNYGVALKSEGKIQAPANSWAHTIEVPLPHQLWHNIPLAVCVNSSVCNNINEIQQQLRDVHNSTCATLDHEYKEILKLFPQKPFFMVKNRAPGEFAYASDITKQDFSNTDHDIRLLQEHINHLSELPEGSLLDFHAHEPYLSSMSRHYLADAHALVKTIKQNQDDLDVLSELVSTTFTDLSNVIAVYVDVQDTLNRIRNLIMTHYSHIRFLKNGRLSPGLINPKKLRAVLLKVEEHLNNSLPEYSLMYLEPDFYYNLVGFFSLRHADSIFISIRFPIKEKRSSLNVYKVNAYSIPFISNPNYTSEVKDVPDYFGISDDGEYYTTLTADEFEECASQKKQQCPRRLQLTSIEQPSCALALYQNSDIENLCQSEITQGTAKPNVKELAPNHIVVVNSENVTIECLGTTEKTNCTFCVLELPCDCTVRSPPFFVPPRNGDCLNISQVHIKYGVNLPELEHLANHRVKRQLKSDTLLVKPLNLRFNDPEILDNTFSDKDIDFEKEQISLKKVADALKKGEPMFLSLDEKLQEGAMVVGQPWWSLSRLWDFATVVVTALIVTVGLYLTTRLREVWALVIPKELAEQHQKHRGPVAKMF